MSKRRANHRRKMGAQDGQAIIVGTLTMLFVLMSSALVYHVGITVDRKIELQNAADSAAYSGAVVKSACANVIEWLNGCMVYVYNNMMTYSFDNMYFSGTSRSLNPIDAQNYSDSYGQSSDWIERGAEWLDRLAQMEDTIANAAPRIIQNEVYDTATRLGADRVALWPDVPEYEYFLGRADSLNCYFQPSNGGLIAASNNDYVLRVDSAVTRGTRYTNGRYFEFSFHDPAFAYNGVNASQACAFFIAGNSSLRDRRTGRYTAGIMGNSFRPYAGFDQVVSHRWPVPDRQGVNNFEVWLRAGNVVLAGPLFLPISATSGDLPFWFSTIVSGVGITVHYLLTWNGGAPYAYITSVEADIGNTQVLSASGYLFVAGRVANGTLSANFTVENGVINIDGLSSLSPSGLFTDYGGVKNRLYVRQRRYLFEKRLRLVDDYPFFVEDNYGRFVQRGLRAPGISRIDPMFGRTQQSDLYSTTVDVRGNPLFRTVVPQRSTLFDISPDYQAIDLMRLPMPLVVTEDFFKYSICVGCWGAPEPNRLLFRAPEQGYFAVACAQVGKMTSTAPDELVEPDSARRILHFPDGTVEFYDPVPYQYVRFFTDVTDRWQRVNTNGAQGYWRAALIPIKEAFLADDLTVGGVTYPTPAEMVFDRLINFARWRANPADDPDEVVPELLRGSFTYPDSYSDSNFTAPFEYSGDAFEDVIQH